MSKLVYRVVRHDGGWAYEANGTFSERFTSHDAARRAAHHAAREQTTDEPTLIEYEDEHGQWHRETALPTDRPKVSVKD